MKPAGLVAHQIANCYLMLGGVTDLEKAIFYAKEAIELGYFDSYINIGSAYNNKGDFKKAFQALLSGYEKGAVIVCSLLGDAYYDGRGTEQSYAKAYEVFKMGAEMNPICKYRQSEMLRKGEGIAPNNDMAYKLLEESAASGFERAQYRLGCDLYEGKLVPRNYTRAVNLLEQALHGQSITEDVKGDIYRKLSICYRFGRGVEANEELANEYNRMAANFGEPNAQKIQEWLNQY